MNNIIIPTCVLPEVVAGTQAQVEAVQRIASMGAAGIEIRRELLTNQQQPTDELQTCRQAIAQSTLQTTIYSVPMEVWGTDGSLNAENIRLAMSEAKLLQAHLVKMLLGHYRPRHSNLASLQDILKPHYFPKMQANVEPSQSAQQDDLHPQLVIENDQTPYGGDPASLYRFFKDMESYMEEHPQAQRVGMTFDTGNWLYAGYEDGLSAATSLSPYVMYIHAKHSKMQNGNIVTVPLPHTETQLQSWQAMIRQLPDTAWRAIEFPLSDDSSIQEYCNMLSEVAAQGSEHVMSESVQHHLLSESNDQMNQQKQTKLDVVTFGEAMTMFVANQPGELHEAELFHKRLAGAEANAAIGFARLGLASGWASRVGNDAFGNFVKQKLSSEHVNVEHVYTDHIRPTGFQLKARVTSGDPEVQYFRKGSAASALQVNELKETYFTSARHLHMTGIPLALSGDNREFAWKVLQAMKQAGRTISFDPNLRLQLWQDQEQMKEVIQTFASYADLVLPGIGEGELLTGSRDPRRIAEAYLQSGAGAVVVKLGPEGAYYRSHEEEGIVPGYIVPDVIDTVGAGDGFAVGVVSGWLNGLSLYDAVSRGCAIGALAVQSVGDHEGYPSESRLQQYMQTTDRYEQQEAAQQAGLLEDSEDTSLLVKQAVPFSEGVN
ncbi:PfkB family carbohydrate kinase [Paenibacillus kandeliae]|uniref:PfkB family carbohydrate kinase n=1 Tax=Paenibacillus kandeliae TaxID=3231269 RepID=UPI00345A9A04